ncbi:MAG: glycosyltransferase [Deltaproteobacteria bacterium]|jgi:glycosyltransferase involved in cell wall biosynthesis|nr:glycosyltransferase [Deltaproteobacteria bacterium]
MEADLISVVIPTYNRCWCLNRSVGSVLAQTGVDFELIVVDDGSSDQTHEFLKPLASEGRLKLISNKERLGVSSARNLGIKAAEGAFIALLDSDDEWLKDKLFLQKQYMDQNPAIMISQCRERWIRNGRRVNPGIKHVKKQGDIFEASLKLCLISPSAVIIRKTLLDEVGLFDETLPSAEDYDLWLRIAKSHKVGLLDEELAIRYAGHDDQLSNEPGLDRYRIRALKKLLNSRLTASQRSLAAEELRRRRKVYEAGRIKRVQKERLRGD